MVTLQWSRDVFLFVAITCALRFDPSQIAYNINTNQTANDPLLYWGAWQNHTYTPSPLNWRIPFYTVSLDRFANGNPNNDDANGTQFEHDGTQTQLRHGGDIKGLQDSLDYLQGMGIKVSLISYLLVDPLRTFTHSRCHPVPQWTAQSASLLTTHRCFILQAAHLSTNRGELMDTVHLISRFSIIILVLYLSGRQQSQKSISEGCTLY